jgi:hypothetical protein
LVKKKEIEDEVKIQFEDLVKGYQKAENQRLELEAAN